MKVLIINSWELEGGAARAANRLHKALLNANIDSTMLVMKKSSDDSTVITPYSMIEQEYNKLLPTISVLPLLKYNKTRQKTLFSPHFMAKDLSKIINDINPDIVHLHWINAGFMSLETLLKISKPIVWSLHDMWAFTGGCHYSDKCKKYLDTCHKCDILGSINENDLSKNIHVKKHNIFSKLNNLSIIGLSKWLSNEAQKSSLFKEHNVINIPNLIDTNLFKPLDKTVARQILNLPLNKKLILYGALHSTTEKRKGYNELNQALNILDISDTEFIVFGSSNSEKLNNKYKTNFVGIVHDDITLKLLYSAADVMVVPSLQENLSNVIMESLACGTPVVGFDIGGNSDMITHKLDGYLAQPFNVEDLKDGIKFVLNQNENINLNARKKVLEKFSSEVVINHYIDLYKSVL